MDIGWGNNVANDNPTIFLWQYDTNGPWINDLVGKIFSYDKKTDSMETALMFFEVLYDWFWKTFDIWVKYSG